MEINKYPDGSSYVNKTYGGYTITKRVNNYEDLWHLNQIVDAYNSRGVRPHITIPWLIDSQADRRFSVGESFGLKLVLDFLGRMNADFRIFHPHNPELVKYALPDVEIMDNSSLIIHVLNDLERGYPAIIDDETVGVDGFFRDKRVDDNTVLLSPDAGAYKPLMKLADTIGWEGEVYSASKARRYSGGKSTLTQMIDREYFNGKDIVIVDDLCVYGGTFKGLSRLLRERNVGKLYLVVSHMTVQNLWEDPVTNYFDKVYTTNSKGYDYIFQTMFGAGHTIPTTYPPTNLEVVKIFN